MAFKALVFDTETTGLPKNYRAPVEVLDNWPRVIQVSWLLQDETGKTLKHRNYIIKPDGFTIPEEASNIHGITTKQASLEGVSVNIPLNEFYSDYQEADFLVAHNISFDEKTWGAEILRAGFINFLKNKPRFCTMNLSTNFCKINGPYGYKWPNLQELHEKLFGERFADGHNAFVDALVAAKCFHELVKLGIIKLPALPEKELTLFEKTA